MQKSPIVFLFILAASFISVVHASEKKYVEFTSPTLRNGGFEVLRFETSDDFPRYNNPNEWHRVSKILYPVASNAPVAGTYTIAYQSGISLMFEIVLGFDNQYLTAVVYYPDGKIPYLFVKQGAGAIFREVPIDPRWTPSQFFLGFNRPSI